MSTKAITTAIDSDIFVILLGRLIFGLLLYMHEIKSRANHCSSFPTDDY